MVSMVQNTLHTDTSLNKVNISVLPHLLKVDFEKLPGNPLKFIRESSIFTLIKALVYSKTLPSLVEMETTLLLAELYRSKLSVL